MEYIKKALSYSEQADLLISRNLLADKTELEEFLRANNYYRLSGYWFHYLNENDQFRENTTLEIIKKNYNFDCELRTIIYRQIEFIEINLKTSIIYNFAHNCGPFGYFDRNNLPNLKDYQYTKLIESFKDVYDKSKEPFVYAFKAKYGDTHENLPIWMLSELMTFGMIMNFYDGMKKRQKKEIALIYNLNSEVLFSWILTINTYRNIIAHYGRIWRRQIMMRAQMPSIKYHEDWHTPKPVNMRSVYGILTVMNFFNNKNTKPNCLRDELNQLFAKYGEYYQEDLGFPPNWENGNLWNKS